MCIRDSGYDEETFFGIEKKEITRQPIFPGTVTLLHSGIVYPAERDPTHFFEALGRLKRTRRIQPSTLKIRFRSAVHNGLLKALAAQHNITCLLYTSRCV